MTLLMMIHHCTQTSKKDILDVYDPNAQWEIYSVDGRNLKLGEKQLSDP